MSLGDLDNQPQTSRRVRVILRDSQDHQLFSGEREVWEGEPLGDWTEFRGIRIALHRDGDVFDGIVPDDVDDHPERTKSGRANQQRN